MSHYKSNLRDIFFNLFEVLGRDEVLGHGPYEDLDHETAVAVLTEVDAPGDRTKLADSFVDGDRDPPVFDPQTQTVALPEAFKTSFRELMDSGVYNLELPAELGGQATPPSLQWAVNELITWAPTRPLLHVRRRTEVRHRALAQRHRRGTGGSPRS